MASVSTTTGRKTLIIVGLAATGLAAAYLAGCASERGRRLAAEQQLQTVQSQLAAASEQVRTGELLGDALTIKELAARQDYGQAAQRSSPFFDAVRTVAAGAAEPALRDAFSAVLASRDQVTAGLARGDATVVPALHDIERRLRSALGYPLPDVSGTQ